MRDLAGVGHVAVEQGAAGIVVPDDAIFAAVAVKHDRAVHRAAAGIHRAAQVQGAAVPCRAVGNTAAVHGERTSFHVHTAAHAFCHAAGDAAAVHGKYAAAGQVHTAAVAVGIAAHDMAGLHNDRAVPADIDTAAIVGSITVPAGNNAAPDGLCAVGFIPHPQAVSLGGKLMLRTGSAVDDGQPGCKAFIIDIYLFSSQIEHIAVQIEDNIAAMLDVQYGIDGDVVRQPDLTHIGVLQRVLQLLRRFHLGGSDRPLRRQGDVLGDGVAGVVPRRAVGLEPLGEVVPRLGGVVGLGGEGAAGQHLFGVVGIAVLVGHDNTGGHTVNKIQSTIIESPVNIAFVSFAVTPVDLRQSSEDGDAGMPGETGDLTGLVYIKLSVHLAAVGINVGTSPGIDSVFADVFDQAAGQRDHTEFIPVITIAIYAAFDGFTGGRISVC